YLSTPELSIVVLASGDPLFFGLGRLLLAELPTEQLTFYPSLSSVQLAFSRIKVPWQDARVISAHGRSLDELTQALQQGMEKIAILTDSTHSPRAIAQLLLSLDLPHQYQVWVCENLGGIDERTQVWPLATLESETFAALNVVILLRLENDASQPLDLSKLPLLGLPDQYFLSFRDRPGLMTKREVRTLVLGELALQPEQVIWDIGAGTGSVSIEIARLFPSSQIYAIEKTAIGSALIQQNSQRFQVDNIRAIHGSAPEALHSLPSPNRIFIGGSGGNLTAILDFCSQQLAKEGVIVLALATLEHLHQALTWLQQKNDSYLSGNSENGRWCDRLLQVQLSRSVPVASLTRFAPLNPVTLLTLNRA
ncbi:MAG: precorrin-6y C5,15-methyltransferase (decarboxylating) subunit CbiE, partial [Leptolyngbyaceae bacterium]|nr:precorrin-6y C5,15-methyltransferase (decarboxylating) subunit CbiE [Leptolyngbyaceae bacterium]